MREIPGRLRVLSELPAPLSPEAGGPGVAASPVLEEKERKFPVTPSNRDTDLVKSLRKRQDVVLGQLHAITRSRDTGLAGFLETLSAESLLVMELGQIQDRLRMLGEHLYDGCKVCRPVSGRPLSPTVKQACP